MIYVKAQLVCDVCDARADIELETKEFGHERTCLFVKEPREHEIHNGWAMIHEHDYGHSRDYWLCPKHWKKTKDWPHKERVY